LDKMRVYMEAAPTDGVYSGKQLNSAYMIKHANSLVGKELRVFGQCASGFLAPLVASKDISKELWQCWYTCGQLACVLLIEEVTQADKSDYIVSHSFNLSNY
jgi:hypothetical protein